MLKNFVLDEKILKILNNDIKSDEKPIYTENSLKVKFIKIDNFEIFFVKGFDKPFVRPKKDSFILAKLYLLTVKEINKIINYINKTKEKFTIKEIINIENTESENNYCELTDNKNNFKDVDISYPYCHFYYVGKFMNISMLLVTNIFNNLESQENNNNSLIYTLPSPRKLYKLIKLLIKSSSMPIFWQFVGINDDNYGILQNLDSIPDRYVDNADFFDLDDFSLVSDSELYARLLNKFSIWLKDIKVKGIIERINAKIEREDEIIENLANKVKSIKSFFGFK